MKTIGLLILGALAGGLGWLAWERHELIMQGEAQERQQMEQANDKEMARAVAAARNVDECFTARGTWDRDRGLCVRPAS